MPIVKSPYFLYHERFRGGIKYFRAFVDIRPNTCCVPDNISVRGQTVEAGRYHNAG